MTKAPKMHCCIICRITYKQNIDNNMGIHFFSFPGVKGDARNTLISLWNKALGKELITRMREIKRNYDNVQFCSMHFKDDDITGNLRKRLKLDAVPSLFLEKESTLRVASPKKKRGRVSEGPSGSDDYQRNKRKRVSRSQPEITSQETTVDDVLPADQENQEPIDNSPLGESAVVDLTMKNPSAVIENLDNPPRNESSVVDLTMKNPSAVIENIDNPPRNESSVVDLTVKNPSVADPQVTQPQPVIAGPSLEQNESQDGILHNEENAEAQDSTDFTKMLPPIIDRHVTQPQPVIAYPPSEENESREGTLNNKENLQAKDQIDLAKLLQNQPQPVIGSPDKEKESQGGTLNNIENAQTEDPTDFSKLLQNIIASSQLDVPTLIQEEKKRAVEQPVDLNISLGDPPVQMVLWERFKKNYQANKLRVRISPNGNGFRILISPSPLMDANDALASDDSGIDIENLDKYAPLPFSLPTNIQELINPNPQLTLCSPGSDRFVLLACDGFTWQFIDCFSVESEAEGIEIQEISEADATECVEIESVAEEKKTGSEVLSVNLSESHIVPTVLNPQVDMKMEEICMEEPLNGQIKANIEPSFDIKAELADIRARLSWISPTTKPIQPATSHLSNRRLTSVYAKGNGSYRTPNRHHEKFMKMRHQTNPRLSSQVEELKKENEKLTKENENLIKEKEDWIKEKDMMKMQLTAMNQVVMSFGPGLTMFSNYQQLFKALPPSI